MRILPHQYLHWGQILGGPVSGEQISQSVRGSTQSSVPGAHGGWLCCTSMALWWQTYILHTANMSQVLFWESCNLKQRHSLSCSNNSRSLPTQFPLEELTKLLDHHHFPEI